MTFYDRLLDETAAERSRFLAIPIIRAALSQGVPRDAYEAFLVQAYHHVKHTCPLLARAAALCTEQDRVYRDALLTYIEEEAGHDDWILEDLRDLGRNPDAVRADKPDAPCLLMITYAYHVTEHVSPYALLGMVHVLEGMSVALAATAATTLQRSLRLPSGKGTRYLSSHGTLDAGHVDFFRDLVNAIDAPGARNVIVDTARAIYPLYGDIFRAIGRTCGIDSDAA